MWHSRDESSSNTTQGMTCCDYCGRQATTQIPTIPGRVCELHAQEFWTGLLAYAREHHSPPNESHDLATRAGKNQSLPTPRLVTAKAGVPLVSLHRAS